MKKSKRVIKKVVALCMAALLCIGALSAAGAASNADDVTPAGRSIYFDNYVMNWAEVYCYAWNDAGEESAAWPGVAMDKQEASSLYLTEVAEAYTHVIFNNGEGIQTFDLDLLDRYDTFFATKIENGKANGFWASYSADYVKVYFSLVYGDWDTANGCRLSYWDGSISQNWPGIEMKMDSESNIYAIKYKSHGSMIINNNNNGKQTVTLTGMLPTNYFGLTGKISGYDQYGNALYEVNYLPPVAG